MVYTLRSRDAKSAKSTGQNLHTTAKKQTTKKKMSNTVRRKSVEEPSASTAKPDGGSTLPIDAEDTHKKHMLDGKDHHIVEQDGRDHHHIWYKDFAPGKDATKGHPQGGAVAAHADIPAPGPQAHGRRGSTSKKESHTSIAASYIHPAPLVIHVDHSHKKHALDGKDHHVTEADGLNHHHIRYGDSTSSSSEHHASSKAHKTTAHSNAASAAHAASTRHFEGTDTTTAKLGEEHSHRLHTMDEGTLRLLSQKSQLDRAKAHEAILSLDGDVIQLQRLLHDKELALRMAESRSYELQHQTTIHTETLTKEVHELEITIRDLRSHLKGKEEALKTSHHQVQKLSTDNKKEHEKAEQQSHKVQKDLAAANSQREKLAHQIQELTKSLHEREQALKTTQSTVKVLERTTSAQSKETQKLNHELMAMKKGMSDRQAELKECHVQIRALEGEHHKVETLTDQLKTLRGQLSERENGLKELEKENKSLNKDHVKANQLASEVKALKHNIQESEGYLKKAQTAVDHLGTFRDRAATLEVEVHDLHDQVNLHERHESDLEDALMQHENCSIESQELQGSISLLQARLNEKNSEIHNLQNSNATLQHKDEQRVFNLQSEVQVLLGEMAGKELSFKKLKEKADLDYAKINSTAGTLKIEVLALRQQLKDKNAEFKSTEKSMQNNMGQVQNQNQHLEMEIRRLESTISAKDKHAGDLDKVIANMNQHADRADRLEIDVKQLQKDSKKASKDLAAASSTSQQLSTQIQTLRGQLSEKEKELKAADKTAQELGSKSKEIKILITKLSGAEKSSHDNLERAHHAEETSKGLKGEIKSLEDRLGSLQTQLQMKELTLQQSLEKSSKDHEEGVYYIEEMRTLVSELRTQMKDAEKDTKLQIKAKEDQIKNLQKQLAGLEKHEESKVCFFIVC